MSPGPASSAHGVDSWRPVIADRLGRWERRSAPANPTVRRAAVAIALFDRLGAANLVIIKRVARGLNPGQWALPGGKIDGDEEPVTAALRELAEETHLRGRPADVLGLLDDVVTTSGYVITPVVLLLADGQKPRHSPYEVASIHPIPVARLLSPAVPRWRRAPSGERLLQMPLRHDMVVHAPTGAILWQFAEVALRGGACRVDGLAEPSFTLT